MAYKDGEDPIEFGPNVELVSYDNSWTLKTLREGTGGTFNPTYHIKICSSAINVIPVHVVVIAFVDDEHSYTMVCLFLESAGPIQPCESFQFNCFVQTVFCTLFTRVVLMHTTVVL